MPAATPVPLSADTTTLTAVRAFDIAAYALSGPRTKVVVDATGRRTITTAPSLYQEMSESTPAQRGTAFGGVARSQPPVWVDASDYLQDIDRTIAGCVEGHVGGTDAILDFLLAWPWTQDDAGTLFDWAQSAAGFAAHADALLDARRSIPLSAACSAAEVARKQG